MGIFFQEAKKMTPKIWGKSDDFSSDSFFCSSMCNLNLQQTYDIIPLEEGNKPITAGHVSSNSLIVVSSYVGVSWIRLVVLLSATQFRDIHRQATQVEEILFNANKILTHVHFV